jgi:hypothetical protein
MSNFKLFTIFLTFSNHETGIGQHEADTPEEVLKKFILTTEALEGYDRQQLQKSIMPLIQIAHDKGVWSFYFDPELMKTVWPNDNAILGGHIVQTDPSAQTR